MAARIVSRFGLSLQINALNPMANIISIFLMALTIATGA